MRSVLEASYLRILDRMGEAALRSGRRSDAVRLIGVTKKVDAARIREVVGCGLKDIGENRVQEAAAKFPLLKDLDLNCHFIGHLQSNKTKAAIELFSCIQSVDSFALAKRLDQLSSHELPVLAQVKLGDEVSKSGIVADDLQTVIDRIRSLTRVKLIGLMGIPPYVADSRQVRPYFQELRRLADRVGLAEVSMGMSHDFEVAIEEGATMVRIGTALFGARA